MKIKEVLSSDQSIGKTVEIAERLRTEFVEETNKFVTQWYESIINKFILTFPPAAEKLTAEHKKNIKIELKVLQDSIHIELTNILMRDQYWWHSGEITDVPRDIYKNIDNLLDFDLRVIFGKVGYILEEYGFIKKNHYDGDKGFVSHKDGSNRYFFEYVYPVYWSDMMKRTMDNYWENYKYYLSIK